MNEGIEFFAGRFDPMKTLLAAVDLGVDAITTQYVEMNIEIGYNFIAIQPFSVAQNQAQKINPTCILSM